MSSNADWSRRRPGEAMPWWLAPWFNLGGSEAPFSGDVAQAINLFSPTVINGAGDPQLEREIVRDVATYGAQLGQLTEVVLALAAQAKLPKSGALDELTAIRDAVEAKKAEYRKSALERARHALAELHEHDAEGYRLLVNSLAADQGR